MALPVSFILCLLLASVFAAPMEILQENQSEETGVRLTRATCDLLSFSLNGNSVNHAACAAHCLVLGRGFRGGRCRDGVCHCRR